MQRNDLPLLDEHSYSTWVDVSVVMAMFGVGKQQAFRIARQEQWRKALGQRPVQWAFEDVHRTWLVKRPQSP